MFRSSKYRVVWRYLWSNSVTNCDIRIWHTFVFLFVIKLFLNCCCSIDVLYCFAFFLYYFAICSLCIKIFICCCVYRRDRYWDNRHS